MIPDWNGLLEANFGNVSQEKVIRLKVRVQEGLAQAYLASDDGSQVFLMCKRGLEHLIQKPLKERDEIEIEVQGRYIGPAQFGD